jgi:hypothetical protein
MAASDVALLTDLVEAGKIKPVIDRSYPLEQIVAVEQGTRRGTSSLPSATKVREPAVTPERDPSTIDVTSEDSKMLIIVPALTLLKSAVNERFFANTDTGPTFWEIAPEKSASVYECFPFI